MLRENQHMTGERAGKKVRDLVKFAVMWRSQAEQEMLKTDTASVVSMRMASIRKVDTKQEIVVRQLLHRLGYRFRLHYKRLPGRPDIVLPKFKKGRCSVIATGTRAKRRTLTPDFIRR
jgi:hypothetical protein